jgi:hypothetical protein
MVHYAYRLEKNHPQEARRWYERAAEAGSSYAMMSLGMLLWRSDPAEARRWYERAAESGDIDAMVHYAYRLTKDHPLEARRWYERAAEAGSPYAMVSLAQLIYGQDPVTARRWFERAAGLGDVPAMRNLGKLLWREDTSAAERWLRQASEAGDLESTALLAKKIRFRHPRQSARLFDQAAEAGEPRAMAEVGNRIVRHNLLLVFRRPGSKAFRQAMDWLTPAAEAGNLDAMRELASLLITSGHNSDGERWLRRAASEGKRSAGLLLGLHYLGQNEPGAAEGAFAPDQGRRMWRAVFLLGRLIARRRRKSQT